MEIKELIKAAYLNAKEHGFWDEKWLDADDGLREAINNQYTLEDEEIKVICLRLLLIHGEISEAMEALRRNDIPNFKEELADINLRLADLCGGLDIDLEAEIIKKMEVNKKRPYKHNKAF